MGLPNTKRYEADGGPGMRDILRILDGSARATEDKRAFVKTQIVSGCSLWASKDSNATHGRALTCIKSPVKEAGVIRT